MGTGSGTTGANVDAVPDPNKVSTVYQIFFVSITNIFCFNHIYFCIAGREAERVLLVVHVVPDVSARRARGARDRVVPGARGVSRHWLHV